MMMPISLVVFQQPSSKISSVSVRGANQSPITIVCRGPEIIDAPRREVIGTVRTVPVSGIQGSPGKGLHLPCIQKILLCTVVQIYTETVQKKDSAVRSYSFTSRPTYSTDCVQKKMYQW